MAEVMLEVQDAKVRRFTQQMEQAAIVEFAAQLSEGLRLIVATGNGGKRREPRAQPCLTSPRPQRAAGHGDTFDAAPSGPGTLQAIPDRLARNPGGGARANQLA